MCIEGAAGYVRQSMRGRPLCAEAGNLQSCRKAELRDSRGRRQSHNQGQGDTQAGPADVCERGQVVTRPGRRFLPAPLKRARQMLRLSRETHDSVLALRSEVHAQIDRARAESASHFQVIDARIEALSQRHDAASSQVVEILRHVHDRGQWRRQELRRLRTDPGYEQPFAVPEPLVSVVIATYDRPALLGERAIPSVLAQSYQNFELIVVGDAASERAREVAEGFEDPRISFVNLPYRGPYPDEPERLWLVGGITPLNEGVQRARGHWIAPLDDDDAWRPHHLEELLERARRDRLELVYSRHAIHFADGRVLTVGRFPPELGQFSAQAAIYHAGLTQIFEYELADAAFGLPSDWAMCLRMMEAGARIGMVDEVTVDLYPSRSWSPRWDGDQYGPWGDAAVQEWEYVPEGWERARNGSVRGWDVEDVAHNYQRRWPEFLAAIDGPEPLGVCHEVPAGAAVPRDSIHDQDAILAFAYAVGRATSRSNGSRALSVLDWGGALGHHETLLRRLLPETKLEYHVRELPAVCEVGRAVHPEVAFHDDDDCLASAYDLVAASNSLQYAEEWQRLLGQLAQSTTGWLFLSRVPLVRDCQSYVSLQRTEAYGYGTEVLGWVLNRGELLRAAEGTRLTLEREFVLHPPYEITGAPERPSLAGFLFRRDGHSS